MKSASVMPIAGRPIVFDLRHESAFQVLSSGARQEVQAILAKALGSTNVENAADGPPPWSDLADACEALHRVLHGGGVTADRGEYSRRVQTLVHAVNHEDDFPLLLREARALLAESAGRTQDAILWRMRELEGALQLHIGVRAGDGSPLAIEGLRGDMARP